MTATVRKFNEVVFIGELSHKKDWLGDIPEDQQKMAMLSAVKEIFDSRVYNGMRCNGESCEGKTCPKEREMNIVLLKESNTEEMITRVIMLHAYQNSEADPVFHVKYSSGGEPIKYIIRVHTYDVDEKTLKIDCEGFFRQVVDNQQCVETRKLMKNALTDEEHTLDVFALMTEKYVEGQ